MGNLVQPPFPSPCIAVRKEVENFGVKLRLRKKGRVWGKALPNLVFLSSSYSDLIGNKIISPRWVCFACVSNW